MKNQKKTIKPENQKKTKTKSRKKRKNPPTIALTDRLSVAPRWAVPPGSSYSALQAPVTGERLKAFGNGPAQFGHEFYFFLYIWDLFKFVNV
jgi:hypothetical protein